MTVAPAVRLLVVTDDSLFSDYTTAAVDRYPDLSVDCVSTLAAARSRLAAGTVDCVCLDLDLADECVRGFNRLLRANRPRLPVVIASDLPRATLADLHTYHAFVRKQGPAMGSSLAAVVRVLAGGRHTDHDRPPATAN